MSLFTEKNTTDQYLSSEIVPLINVPGIWFEEKDVLDFTDDDTQNFNQFLKDRKPKLIAENSDTICIMDIINGMPPLIKDINTNNNIQNFAPIKGIAYSPDEQHTIKGYRSGTRSAILKAKVYNTEEFDKLENKNNLWVIAKCGNKVYIPDDKDGNTLIRLKGCSMWTQKSQNEYQFPYVLLRPCEYHLPDKDPNKKYIKVRGFNSVNSSEIELFTIRELKPFFDKLKILMGNLPLGFWKYVNLRNDPSPNIEKCVCVMETIGDKRVETHFFGGAEKILDKLISEENCKELLNKLENIYKDKNITPPSSKNMTFNKASKLPLNDMGISILKKRYSFDKAMDNFEATMNSKGFIDSKYLMEIIKNYEELYTLALIYAEIGYEAGRILSVIHRTGNNWGMYINAEAKFIDYNAHGDNLIILNKEKVKERFEKEKIFQIISMVDFDHSVRSDTSLNFGIGEIKKEPRVATKFFSYELGSLTADLGGIANESTPLSAFMSVTIRPKPLGPYYNLLYMLRDCMIYELIMSYIDPMRERHFEKDLNVDKMYDLIEKCLAITVNNEA